MSHDDVRVSCVESLGVFGTEKSLFKIHCLAREFKHSVCQFGNSVKVLHALSCAYRAFGRHYRYAIDAITRVVEVDG